jgi:mono/diheme cytochrome c family protein
MAFGFPLFILMAVVATFLIAAQGGLGALSLPNARALAVPEDAATRARGQYLAQIGDCVACHTARGGAALAGGRAFRTPWGVLYSSNLTPDPEHGIGDWSAEQFRHALAHGVGRSGLLYPAFPFENFQHLTPTDADAIFAWLRSQPPVAARPPDNTLDGLAGWRPALIGWRMLFHRPWELPFDDSRGASWNRGRYLVEGIAHCSMCHGERGLWGAANPARRFAGERIPGQGWVAPPLDGQTLAHWSVDDLAGYLRTGVAPQASAFGPMADVVQASLQHLTQADARAIAEYILSLPPMPQRPAPPARPARDLVGSASTALYEKHCAECHGRDGRGRDRIYPPLDGNPQVVANDPVNLIRIVLFGGAPPTTPGNPAPHSMPPFTGHVPEADLIAILNHVRGSWNNRAGAIQPYQLHQARELPLE